MQTSASQLCRYYTGIYWGIKTVLCAGKLARNEIRFGAKWISINKIPYQGGMMLTKADEHESNVCDGLRWSHKKSSPA